MSNSVGDDEAVEKSGTSKIKIKVDPSLHDSPQKKRHVIKGKNVKTVNSNEKDKSSPLAKSLGLIGRLSKKGKPKETLLSLNESYESVANVDKTKCGNNESNVITTVPERHASPCPSSRINMADMNSKATNKASSKKETSVKETTKTKKKGKKKESSVRSHVLTEYYPVRRSSRKSKAAIEKENTDSIVEAIRSKNENGLAIKEFKDKGRGIVAKRALKKGAFIVEYAGELIDWNEARHREEEYSKDLSVGCYMYYFVFNNTNYCVDATAESGRLGRLLNHSRKNPNCKTKLVPVSGADDKVQPRLIIIAKRDITAGEELTYDYGDRDKATLQSHPWLKST